MAAVGIEPTGTVDSDLGRRQGRQLAGAIADEQYRG
jgi:hypothetical protein